MKSILRTEVDIVLNNNKDKLIKVAEEVKEVVSSLQYRKFLFNQSIIRYMDRRRKAVGAPSLTKEEKSLLRDDILLYIDSPKELLN